MAIQVNNDWPWWCWTELAIKKYKIYKTVKQFWIISYFIGISAKHMTWKMERNIPKWIFTCGPSKTIENPNHGNVCPFKKKLFAYLFIHCRPSKFVGALQNQAKNRFLSANPSHHKKCKYHMGIIFSTNKNPYHFFLFLLHFYIFMKSVFHFIYRWIGKYSKKWPHVSLIWKWKWVSNWFFNSKK